jgi:diadenylate cyclase
MLKNIFFNKAPMHDGAVVIHNNRIYAAGCFLPMSKNDDIIKDLGTRHRSAIGMSEESDAVVIVVSEETGTISIALNGELRRNYDYNSLKHELTSLLGAADSEDN